MQTQLQLKPGDGGIRNYGNFVVVGEKSMLTAYLYPSPQSPVHFGVDFVSSLLSCRPNLVKKLTCQEVDRKIQELPALDHDDIVVIIQKIWRRSQKEEVSREESIDSLVQLGYQILKNNSKGDTSPSEKTKLNKRIFIVQIREDDNSLLELARKAFSFLCSFLTTSDTPVRENVVSVFSLDNPERENDFILAIEDYIIETEN